MNKIFEYSLGYKLIYKYGIIFLNLIIIIYLIPAISMFEGSFFQILYIISHIAILFLFNRYFYNLYKIMPYRIETDEDGIICTNYVFSSKKVKIKFEEIDNLSGGIFDGKVTGLMKIHVSNLNYTVGFFPKIGNSKALESLILSKVSKELYEGVLEKFSIKKEELKRKIDKNKK